MTDVCAIDDCGRPAKRAGLCEGHRARKAKGLPLTPLRQYGNPARTLAEASFAFADAAADDEASYYRAWKRLCTAARRYVGTK